MNHSIKLFSLFDFCLLYYMLLYDPLRYFCLECQEHINVNAYIKVSLLVFTSTQSITPIGPTFPKLYQITLSFVTPSHCIFCNYALIKNEVFGVILQVNTQALQVGMSLVYWGCNLLQWAKHCFIGSPLQENFTITTCFFSV